LTRWKVGHRLKELSSSPETFAVHRYNDGSILGKRENYGEEMLAKYKSPFWDMHRADLQIALFERAKDLGVNFKLGALVNAIDLKAPSVTLASGELIQGDLIVAANGK
jgi:salicylate hydroxylase